MRLCHCPNCKQEIEPDAPICPHCAANVNQHRARDVARILLFGMAVVFVFTLVAAINDAGPRRAERTSGDATRLSASSAVAAPAPASPSPCLTPPPERPVLAAEDDPALNEWRPAR